MKASILAPVSLGGFARCIMNSDGSKSTMVAIIVPHDGGLRVLTLQTKVWGLFMLAATCTYVASQMRSINSHSTDLGLIAFPLHKTDR
jgi:hypothetical protein